MESEKNNEKDFDPAVTTAKIKGTIDYLSSKKVVKYIAYGVGGLLLIYASGFVAEILADTVIRFKKLDNAINAQHDKV